MPNFSSTLQTGDVVRLRSDGPAMTIGVLSETELICLWAEPDGKLRLFEWFDCLPSPDLFERIEGPADPVSSSLAVGSLVRLRSSRQPLMTVHSVHPSSLGDYKEAHCFWFTAERQLTHQRIPVGALLALAIEPSDN